MVYCLWWSQFDLLAEQTAKRLLKTSVTLHEIAHALPRQGGMEFVIGQVIPSHGLDLLAKCFEGTTGRSLPDALNKQAPALWSQIHSAFEVRHLIEHRKGKIDQRFIDEVASHPLWDNSSWTDFPLSVRAKIEVRAKDFDATCDAMIRAAEIVTALTRECWLG
jgi:hypothetical protein